MTLIDRLRRGFARLTRTAAPSPEKRAAAPRPFTLRTHCGACGTDRWGKLHVTDRKPGALAMFRCEAAPSAAHVTAYSFQRNKTGALTLRALSRLEHVELAAKVRAQHLRAKKRAEFLKAKEDRDSRDRSATGGGELVQIASIPHMEEALAQ